MLLFNTDCANDFKNNEIIKKIRINYFNEMLNESKKLSLFKNVKICSCCVAIQWILGGIARIKQKTKISNLKRNLKVTLKKLKNWNQI